MNQTKLISTSCALAFALCLPLTAWAQGPPALQARVAALEAAVATLQTNLATANAAISALQTALGGLADLAPFVSVELGPINGLAGPHVIITGANVHIQSGSGATDDNSPGGGSLTGLGNLVVGYNEPRPLDTSNRTGSHNLIVGPEHQYPSFGGFVAGFGNSVTASNASVSGGGGNITSGNHASVSGGVFNTASGGGASVSGGDSNTASGNQASVSGGRDNIASGTQASVSGGVVNTASGSGASVSGGDLRTAEGLSDWVAGALVQDF